jgi:hypothetical protein
MGEGWLEWVQGANHMADTHRQIDGVLYKYLCPKPGSNYRQLFVGRIRAEILYRETVGPEALTPAQVAEEYGVPVEAVLEAIEYSVRNKELLDQERAEEEADIRARGFDKCPHAPRDYQPS